MKVIIVDTDQYKNPCEECSNWRKDLQECNITFCVPETKYRAIQSILSQGKPIEWLDEKVCDYYRKYPNCVNFFKPADQNNYKPFS